MIKVLYYWSKAFLSAFCLVVLASLLAVTVNQYYCVPHIIIRLLNLATVVCNGTVLYGLNIWEIPAWSNDSRSKKLNRAVNVGLISIGLIFTILANALKST